MAHVRPKIIISAPESVASDPQTTFAPQNNLFQQQKRICTLLSLHLSRLVTRRIRAAESAMSWEISVKPTSWDMNVHVT